MRMESQPPGESTLETFVVRVAPPAGPSGRGVSGFVHNVRSGEVVAFAGAGELLGALQAQVPLAEER